MNKLDVARRLFASANELQLTKRRLEITESRLSGFEDALLLLNATRPSFGMTNSEDQVGANRKMAEDLTAEFYGPDKKDEL